MLIHRQDFSATRKETLPLIREERGILIKDVSNIHKQNPAENPTQRMLVCLYQQLSSG